MNVVAGIENRKRASVFFFSSHSRIVRDMCVVRCVVLFLLFYSNECVIHPLSFSKLCDVMIKKNNTQTLRHVYRLLDRLGIVQKDD